MNATVFWLLLIPNSLVFYLISDLLFFEHVELLLDTLFFILKKFLLELIDLSLFILVNIVEFTLFKIKFTIFID